jgi:hypothetical protein
LICFRDEYCEESAPPRYWLQVAKERSAADTGFHINRRIGRSKSICAGLRITGTSSTGKCTTAVSGYVVARRRPLDPNLTLNSISV